IRRSEFAFPISPGRAIMWLHSRSSPRGRTPHERGATTRTCADDAGPACHPFGQVVADLGQWPAAAIADAVRALRAAEAPRQGRHGCGLPRPGLAAESPRRIEDSEPDGP